MKLKLPKIKIIQILLSLKYFYSLVTILVVGIIVILGLFLYNNLYQTIAQSKEIILLRQEVAPDSIDMEKVSKILEKLNKKTTANDINWAEIKNPFILIESFIPIQNPTPTN